MDTISMDFVSALFPSGPLYKMRTKKGCAKFWNIALKIWWITGLVYDIGDCGLLCVVNYLDDKFHPKDSSNTLYDVRSFP